MSQANTFDLRLDGCTPEPLMAYLKALGILRLISEQEDHDARGWWQDDVFWLRSRLDRDTLVAFWLKQYKPTPIVAPWAGGSGFFEKDNKQAVEELLQSDSQRLACYREVIKKVRAIIADERIDAKPKDDAKARLIRRYRRELSDELVAWIDAAMVVHENNQAFAPLLGTGGNDGRLDFTQNFMQRLITLKLHKNELPTPESNAWLQTALFDTVSQLGLASVGQFAPGRAGGPNASQGTEGDPLDNPWDFVLMMEGTLMLAGAAVRRFGASGRGQSSFPFTVSSVAAGFDSASFTDQRKARGEMWLPLWSRPATLAELRHLFSEGRAEVSGRPAADGTDFARAATSLGVDRGIESFCRLGFLQRSGKSFLAAPLGRLKVADRAPVDLFREIDPWLSRLQQALKEKKDKNVPPRFVAVYRRIAGAMLDYCTYGGQRLFQEVLKALGSAERELAGAERFRTAKGIKPLEGLSRDWIAAADDNSPEFALARSLAFVYDPEGKVGPLRSNLEPVSVEDSRRRRQMVSWAAKGTAAVWNAADLCSNLTRVLDRRIMDGARAGCECLPLASAETVSLDTVAAFLEGQVDDRRIEELLWGLVLVDSSQRVHRPGGSTGAQGSPGPHTGVPNAQHVALIPRDFALLKLLFLPAPLVPERSGTTVRWRLGERLFHGREQTGSLMRPEPRVLSLVRAGRIGEACQIAVQRLRASGLPPMPGPGPDGATRDHIWTEGPQNDQRARRLAAALLFPLAQDALDVLVKLICRDSAAAAETLSPVTVGDLE